MCLIMQNFEKYISKTQNLKSLNMKNKSLKNEQQDSTLHNNGNSPIIHYLKEKTKNKNKKKNKNYHRIKHISHYELHKN